MKKMLLLAVLIILAISICSLYADEAFTLTPEDYSSTIIVTPGDPLTGEAVIPRLEVIELQKHLQLVTGHLFKIQSTKFGAKKAFWVGVVPESDKKKIMPDEGRYLVTKNDVYMYGGDNIRTLQSTMISTFAQIKSNQTGTLYAVYDFLEYELGIKWIEPGDDGIVYQPNSNISIPAKSHSWLSQFTSLRYIRCYPWNYENFKTGEKNMPKEFRLNLQQFEYKRDQTKLWIKRMRMGNRGEYYPFNQSFMQYWDKYGKEHPDWFAVNGKGVHAPMGKDNARVKMCTSSLGLAQEVVRLYKNKECRDYTPGAIDATENDTEGFGSEEYCHCPLCEKLGTWQPTDPNAPNLTDRYIFFWNRIWNIAKKGEPKVKIDGYAYQDTLQPPRQQKLLPGINIKMITEFAEDFAETRQIFEGWRKAGMTYFMFRPNDLNAELGLPMGTEKRLFEHQKMAIEYGAQGIDHDTLYDYWTGLSGIAYYIVAKQILDPSKPFEYWEDEYCSVYGAAKEDIKSYYKYWREEVMEKRILPQKAFGYWYIGKYGGDIYKCYFESDFDNTDKYLESASQKNLTPLQRKLLNRLIIGAKHNRLIFRAMLANKEGASEKGDIAAKELLDYRIMHKDDLYFNWNQLFGSDSRRCGISRIINQPQYNYK